MAKRISAAKAKAHFSELIAKVAYGGARFVIERRGKPMAAIVSVEDAERLARTSKSSVSEQARGALALVGAWEEVMDDELDEFVRDVYAARQRDKGRPVDLSS